jgi:hypothetical protein
VKDAGFLILILLIVAVVWITIGGNSFKAPSSPQISQNQELTTAGSEKEEKPSVTLSSGSAGWSDDPDREYIEIQAPSSNKKPINITGWRLKNKNGQIHLLPSAAKLVYSARVNTQENILLEPGQKAVVVSGKSPIGANFLLNICAGYFNQQNEFFPGIYQNCPQPKDEPAAKNQKDACVLYLRSLSSCRMPENNLPLELDNDCREFIARQVNYAGCVEAHRNDAGFFSDEWRVYLEKSDKIWSNVSEDIQLFDQNSNLVAKISY